MIVTLTFKTPDVLEQLENKDLTNYERSWIEEQVNLGEYITIEFDTDKKTKKVR